MFMWLGGGKVQQRFVPGDIRVKDVWSESLGANAIRRLTEKASL